MSDHDDHEESFVEAHLVSAVENQLSAENPACTVAVLNKLTLVGYEREDIVHMMAVVLADEIETMMTEDRPFDVNRYEQLLRALPEMPGAEAEEDAE
ncbi:hypothetical protein IQ22_00738 [Pseudomonas duriflava]|uniref:Uncharacterized protein n=1 Tax=Pseudomonas duriflava TaxID=459528 RepID=A0A562QL94_9PSED|nr:hypothetical protein [Pseudomonas duriflava]TWI57521.1 hypothetical protein IQ22_00738 [Pseudomonas duriflava]